MILTLDDTLRSILYLGLLYEGCFQKKHCTIGLLDASSWLSQNPRATWCGLVLLVSVSHRSSGVTSVGSL